MYPFVYFDRGKSAEKFNQYLQKKISQKPLPIDFGAKLINALLDYFAAHLTRSIKLKEATDALYGLIISRYQNLRDIFNDSGYKALEFLFDEKAPIIKEIWLTSFDYGYQVDSMRRPFRTKYGVSAHFYSKTNLLYRFTYLTAIDFDLQEFLEDPYAYQRDRFIIYAAEFAVSMLITYEIDHGNQQVRDQVEKIVYENSGGIRAEILQALVQSKLEWSHKLLGDLLIAAKLQEGLRQSIVERMDCGSIEAFKYLLQIIIDQKLERFSSVVRAFDVWTGLAVSAQKPSTIRYYLNVIQDCVINVSTMFIFQAQTRWKTISRCCARAYTKCRTLWLSLRTSSAAVIPRAG